MKKRKPRKQETLEDTIFEGFISTPVCFAEIELL